MVETKRNALPLERGKALPAQNRGITAEWQGNKQSTGGCGGLFICGKRKSKTNGGGRRTYISPKGCPTHQVKHGTEKHNGHSEMAEPQTKTQKRQWKRSKIAEVRNNRAKYLSLNGIHKIQGVETVYASPPKLYIYRKSSNIYTV